jgi:sec-independent protein translocase protein TatA
MVSTQTLLIVGAVVVVIFGAAKLPQLGKGIGEAIKNFKKAVSEPGEIDVTPKKDDEKKEVKEEKK